MIPKMFSTAGWLASLLRRWANKGYIPNVSLTEGEAAPGIALEEGELSIALIRTADGRHLVLTGERIIEGSITVLRYGDVVGCHWITDHPDPWERARLKRTHPHRLIVDLKGGRKVMLDQLGQAVFPLLRFFDSIA